MAYDEEDFEDELQSFIYEEEKKDAVKKRQNVKVKNLLGQSAERSKRILTKSGIRLTTSIVMNTTNSKEGINEG